MSGKGSVARPLSVPRAEYDRRWTAIFGESPSAREERELQRALDDAVEEYLLGRRAAGLDV